jgi:hypothetical protein
MSSDYIPVLVSDKRMDLRSKLDFEVYSGANSVSPSVFGASTNSSNNLNFSITSPSFQTILDMNIMVDTDIIYTITGTPTNGTYLVNYAISDCLAPFCFNQLINNASVNINQSQVSLNVSDALPALLPLISRDELSKFNCMTPTMLDNVQNYYQGFGGANPYLTSQSSVFKGYYSNNVYDKESRGSFSIKSITGNNLGAANAVQTVVVTVHVTEPLLVSPMLFGKVSSGIAGIQAINMSLSMDASGKRSWRTATPLGSSTTAPGGGYNVSVAYGDPKVMVNFLAPKASQLIKYSPRNILPFTQLNIYNNLVSPAAGTGSLSSPSIQLSSIPKTVMVYIRKDGRTWNDADFYIPITGVSINFNVNNGILSGCNQQALYVLSQQAGLQQTWGEFSGRASDSSGAGTLTNVTTQSGPVVLEFARDIYCSSEFDAPGNIGSFNFSITVQYNNLNLVNAPIVPATTGIQLFVVMANSGIYSTESGNSSSFTNILSKSDVLSVLSDKAVQDVQTSELQTTTGEELTGGRKGYGRSGGMGPSGGGKSAGRKLSSRLM